MSARPKISGHRSPYANSAVGSVGFTIGAEASNAKTVNVQLKNQSLDDAGATLVHWYLSSDAAGLDFATAADGGVAAGTDGSLKQTVTGIAGIAISEADGDLDVVITHAAGAKTVYLNIVVDGTLYTSAAITFA